MIKKLIQYKRMIGDATVLAGQNHDLLMQNRNLLMQNRDLLMQNRDLVLQNREIYQQLYQQLSDKLMDKIEMQNEIAAVNTAAFADYKNVHTGREIVILGAGPTLNKYVPLDGAIHIGVNKVCTYNSVQLDYYFIQHFLDLNTKKSGFSSCLEDIINLKCRKFFGMYVDIELNAECSESYFFQNYNSVRYYVDHLTQKHLYPNIC